MDGLDKITLLLVACLVVVALLFPLTGRILPGRRRDEREREEESRH